LFNILQSLQNNLYNFVDSVSKVWHIMSILRDNGQI